MRHARKALAAGALGGEGVCMNGKRGTVRVQQAKCMEARAMAGCVDPTEAIYGDLDMENNA